MLTGIQPYNIKQSYVKPSFQAIIPKDRYIPVKNRHVKTPENITKKFIANVKEILFEAFPKLDPEYVKYAGKFN